jgi:hypothetical protein
MQNSKDSYYGTEGAGDNLLHEITVLARGARIICLNHCSSLYSKLLFILLSLNTYILIIDLTIRTELEKLKQIVICNEHVLLWNSYVRSRASPSKYNFVSTDGRLEESRKWPFSRTLRATTCTDAPAHCTQKQLVKNI